MTILRMWFRTKNLSSLTDFRIITSSLIDQFQFLHFNKVITNDNEINKNKEKKEKESKENKENEEDDEEVL
jgi:hypothetical protein